ncbi:MAG: 23S rRNA (adenine(2503)-C(2))-methyltransferase RlmN [Spirochaetaceae bacterium]|jgi:23S rRNA (adenine2503-C2)-methyltransferase|nr:23S rRNA (adenine(2503)-C(2))-methyltransferase RlmN [Spirochaetaceae bacterium]
METKKSLAGLLPGELADLLNADLAPLLKSPLPSFRIKQIFKWMCSGVSSFGALSDIPLALRKILEEKFTLLSGSPRGEFTDSDGTVKLRIALEDGANIEAVMLRDGKDRKTACLSTQAGCQAGCVFCKTGRLGFKRNLTSAEISSQFLRLRGKDPEISHIVVMGMGEPLLNLEELRKAIGFMTFPEGPGISGRRITLSTCGIVPGILDLAEKGPDVRLALSLTSARQELRERLMPVAGTYPLPLVKESLLWYQKKMKRRITLEAVLLGGINTGPEDALAIADFAEGLETVVNLIPWNVVEGVRFAERPVSPPGQREVSDFALALERRGLKVTRRRGKGSGISGACGQLGSLG